MWELLAFASHSKEKKWQELENNSDKVLWILQMKKNFYFIQFSSVAQLCPTLCSPMDCSTSGLPVHQQLLELTQTHVHSSHPLSSPSSPAFSLSSIRVSSKESVLCTRWPKYWSFSFSVSPSSEYSGLILFRMDCLDLAVQGTLKYLLQHRSWKASVLRYSAFFMVQLSHPHVTIGKTIALTRWTFVSKVISAF